MSARSMGLPGDDDADVVAAGVVLWRPGADGESQVALVHRPRYDDWSLPKGKLDAGETASAAAVREAGEETGFAAALRARLRSVRYRVVEGRKVVHYWSARAGDGWFVPTTEVDELSWVSPGTADGVLSYPHDRRVLDDFRRLPVDAGTVLLVRHGKAGSRSDWNGDDDLRPLTGKGSRQAKRLTELLALFGPTRVHSAPPLRCVQTVRPLAEELGVSVVGEPLLGEEGYWRDPEGGLRRLFELAAGAGVVVACSQGGAIPDILERLTGEADPPARKASTWALGLHAGRLVSADHYPAPDA